MDIRQVKILQELESFHQKWIPVMQVFASNSLIFCLLSPLIVNFRFYVVIPISLQQTHVLVVKIKRNSKAEISVIILIILSYLRLV